MNKPKLIRTATVPVSLNILLKGQLKFLAKHFDVVGVSSPGPDLEVIQKREGITTITVEMQRNISPIKDAMALFKMYRVLKREQPLIVHSITPKAGLVTMLAGKAAGVPIRMHTFTGLVFPTRTGIMQQILIKTDQLLCRAATHVYPEGQGVKNDLQKYKITNKPLKVLANGNVNGVDLTHFDPSRYTKEQVQTERAKVGIAANDFVFIFVGRLVGDKGINELITAFKALSLKDEEGSGVKLLLVGPLESELDPLQSETIKAIETNPNIISVGFQADVRPYFAISDCLVFPSYREGFPNVVLQAGAMGLPSIVTNINGCNEIIEEGVNGTIIPVKNAQAITQAMQQMRSDTAYFAYLKKNARPLIQARFEQTVVWKALLEEYSSLMQIRKANE